MVEIRVTKYTPGVESILHQHISTPYSNGIDTRNISNNNEPSYYTLKRNQEHFKYLKILENNYIPQISKLKLAQICLDEYFENKNEKTKYSFSIMNGGLFQEWSKNDFYT
uniref:Uncharacterized protein n=1 Tax=viral metagenome TaxID=1070528 RepID=A0A6C0CPM0_9ZZZZ